MFKTPVSLLQEMMVQKRLPMPNYEIVTVGNPSFECTVTVQNIKVSAVATTKQAAKQKSAKSALEKLGYLSGDMELNENFQLVKPATSTPVAVQPPRPMANYIGYLNEYASKKGLAYPDYHEGPMEALMFTVICSFNNFKTTGKAPNKKDAKQKAAEEMFKRLEENKDSVVKCEIPKASIVNDQLQTETTEKGSKEKNEDDERVLKIFSQLSINGRKGPAEDTTDAACYKVKTESLPGLYSIEDCKNFLDKLNVKYEVNEFQKDPLVLHMVIRNTNQHILMDGNSYDEALFKAYKHAIGIYTAVSSIS